jgi:tetraacyldisaccharide 4'-kinase
VLAAAPALPIFHGRLEPDAAALAVLRPRKVLAFAGIGDPGKFFATLTDADIDVRARQAFPDHHLYRRAEAADLIARAERDGLVLVTTEKDLVRLQRQDDLRALAGIARALPVTLAVEEADAFRQFVLERVS